MKTWNWRQDELQVQNFSKSEKDQIKEKSPKEEWKGQSQSKVSLNGKDIFKDTWMDLSGDAACAPKVAIGAQMGREDSSATHRDVAE